MPIENTRASNRTAVFDNQVTIVDDNSGVMGDIAPVEVPGDVGRLRVEVLVQRIGDRGIERVDRAAAFADGAGDLAVELGLVMGVSSNREKNPRPRVRFSSRPPAAHRLSSSFVAD
jgi:hypothetical protein